MLLGAAQKGVGPALLPQKIATYLQKFGHNICQILQQFCNTNSNACWTPLLRSSVGPRPFATQRAGLPWGEGAEVLLSPCTVFGWSRSYPIFWFTTIHGSKQESQNNLGGWGRQELSLRKTPWYCILHVLYLNFSKVYYFSQKRMFHWFIYKCNRSRFRFVPSGTIGARDKGITFLTPFLSDPFAKHGTWRKKQD